MSPYIQNLIDRRRQSVPQVHGSINRRRHIEFMAYSCYWWRVASLEIIIIMELCMTNAPVLEFRSQLIFPPYAILPRFNGFCSHTLYESCCSKTWIKLSTETMTSLHENTFCRSAFLPQCILHPVYHGDRVHRLRRLKCHKDKCNLLPPHGQ